MFQVVPPPDEDATDDAPLAAIWVQYMDKAHRGDGALWTWPIKRVTYYVVPSDIVEILDKPDITFRGTRSLYKFTGLR